MEIYARHIFSNRKGGEAVIYAIWKDINDNHVDGVKDLIGYIETNDYKEADKIVEEMNEADLDVQNEGKSLNGSYRYGYWKQEINRITSANSKSFVYER
jgi:hypothetical protein